MEHAEQRQKDPDFLTTKENINPPHKQKSIMDLFYEGKKLCRKEWTDILYIALQTPDKNSKMTLPYIYCETITGDLMPWQASTNDAIAQDWEFYEED